MSRLFSKLKGHQQPPPGIEREILRLVPQVFVFGVLGLALPALLARLFPITGSLGEVLRWIQTVDIYVISFELFFCTMMFTVALGAFIVMIMKGPAYVADAYPLIDFDKPYVAPKKEV